MNAEQRANRLWENFSGAFRRRKDKACEHWPGLIHIAKEIRLAEAAAFGRGYRAGLRAGKAKHL